MAVRIALPEYEGPGVRYVEVDENLDPTDAPIPTRIERAIRSFERAGWVPGSFAVLWDGDTTRAIVWNDGACGLPLNLDEMWEEA